MNTEQKDYTEKIVIKNFGGIKDLEMPINKINVLIGPQAAGKSMVAKLLYYFKEFLTTLTNNVLSGKTKKEINSDYVAKFKELFPVTAWPKNYFEIHYFIGNIQLSINRKKVRSITFEYSDVITKWLKSDFIAELLRSIKLIETTKEDNLKKITDKKESLGEFIEGLIEIMARGWKETLPINLFEEFKKDIIKAEIFEAQIFIPTGRSFYADLQANIFSFLSSKNHIDPFLIEFGKIYENYKQNVILHDEKILKAIYKRERNKDFLVHKDGRKVNLSYASSGQQEVLPLLVILQGILSGELATNGATLYIEEPEAHLFPNAQKEIVELLAKVANNPNNNIQIVVTTHSPYILSAFNNLLYAGEIEENSAENEEKLAALYETVEKESVVKPNTLNAFAMIKGEKTNIIDEETQLIGDNVLDEISNVIANQFDKLLDLDD